LIKDSKTTLVSSVPAAGLVTGDSLLWAYAGLKPFDSYTIDIEVKLAAPPTLNNGDTLRYKAFINSTTGSAAAVDLTPLDDTAHLAQVVVGSYDPNDKQENVAGKIPLAKVATGEDIQYIIRFQNTGTDTAFTIRITDTLDTKLNWNSLQMIGASHSYKMTVVDGNKISWTFPNINLPDSNVNEPLSHGYIAFRIKAKSNLTAGEYFQNKASIYFDYNLPVETNRTTTVVSTGIITNVRNLSNNDIQLLVLPNPTNGNFYLKLNGRLSGKFECSIIDLYGRVIQTQVIERGNGQDVQLIPLQLERVSAGVYHVILRQKAKIWQQRIIVQ
jgi:fimbrial isopeptide formation D2 family protein